MVYLIINKFKVENVQNNSFDLTNILINTCKNLKTEIDNQTTDFINTNNNFKIKSKFKLFLNKNSQRKFVKHKWS